MWELKNKELLTPIITPAPAKPFVSLGASVTQIPFRHGPEKPTEDTGYTTTHGSQQGSVSCRRRGFQIATLRLDTEPQSAHQPLGGPLVESLPAADETTHASKGIKACQGVNFGVELVGI